METLINRTAPPASQPVSLDQAKAQVRVLHDDDDSYIEGLVKAATAAVEEMTGRALITQTWSLSLRFPQKRIYLPKTPVQSINAITYYDRDEVEQNATVGHFHLFSDIYRAWVEPKDKRDWPDVFGRPDALTITFVAGYGAAEDVPFELRQAILMLVAHWYENREAVVTGAGPAEMPMAVEAMTGLHRTGWIGA